MWPVYELYKRFSVGHLTGHPPSFHMAISRSAFTMGVLCWLTEVKTPPHLALFLINNERKSHDLFSYTHAAMSFIFAKCSNGSNAHPSSFPYPSIEEGEGRREEETQLGGEMGDVATL